MHCAGYFSAGWKGRGARLGRELGRGGGEREGNSGRDEEEGRKRLEGGEMDVRRGEGGGRENDAEGKEEETCLCSWGRAKNYRLGRSTDTSDVRRPEKVDALANLGISQGACGGGHTCVVLDDNRLFVFGYSQYGQVGLGDRSDVSQPLQVKIVNERGIQQPVVQVACGRYHTVALTAAGDVYTWGGGKNGRLGHGDEKIRTIPTKVTSFHSPVRAIACGYHSSVAIVDDGVYTWGWGAHGQLGHGDSNDRMSPHKMASINEEIVAVTCGDRHGFALTANGVVYGWGSNEFGQLGIGRRGEIFVVAAKLDSLAGLFIREISSGDRHSAALTNMGVVYTWGCGTDGQCGHGVFHHSPRPQAVKSIPCPVEHVVCGHNFTMALAADHSVYAWGNNTYGQLGLNLTTSAVATPMKISIGTRVRGLTCGHFHGILWTGPEESTNAKDQRKSGAGGENSVDSSQRLLQELSEDRLARNIMLEQLGKLCV